MGVSKYTILSAFLLIFLLNIAFGQDVVAIFKATEIIPDVVKSARTDDIEPVHAKFPNGLEMWFGPDLPPKVCQGVPTIAFSSTPDVLYTVIMVDVDYRLSHPGVVQLKDRQLSIWSPGGSSDYHMPWKYRYPDSPSHLSPSKRHWLHWLVGNIDPYDMGTDYHKASIVADYNGPNPAPGTGRHRYVLLVYRQEGIIAFGEYYKTNDWKRGGFNLNAFVKKFYKLKGPIAGNFFYSSSDH